MSLSNKIDFAIIISVNNANPNGDPLNGNRPRTNYDGYGEMSDVCIKRKLRNRLLDSGEKILVQSNDYRIDEYESIQGRYSSVISQKQQKMNSTDQVKIACSTWFDVRAFGQVLAFKKAEKETKKESESITESESETKKESEKGLSISIRGPVSIQSAFSVETVDISTLQITKSLNNMINWYIGTKNDFAVAPGKMGKYFKNFLDERQYKILCETYSDSDYNNFWNAIFKMCELFRETAKIVAEYFNFEYIQSDDDNMTEYLRHVRNL